MFFEGLSSLFPFISQSWDLLTRALCVQIQQQQSLCPGSEEEIEIRAATVVAVERLRQAISRRFGPQLQQQGSAHNIGAVEPTSVPTAYGQDDERNQASKRHKQDGGAAASSGPDASSGQVDYASLARRWKQDKDIDLPCAVQLDWWLWHQGEASRQQHPPPHHSLTIFY